MDQERIIFILDYLSRYTDENKAVTIKDIQHHLANVCNLSRVNDVTIRRDLDRLTSAGNHIVKYRGEHNTAYYALIDKGFSFNEIRFIVDSISINKFLSAYQKQKLIKKFEGMCSDTEIRQLISRIVLNERCPSTLDLLENLDKIHRLIGERRKIAVRYNNDMRTVSGRELHAALMIDTPYHKWFPRMCEYGFAEGIDFNSDKNVRVQIEGSRSVSREVTDHQLTIDMAKELCMIQRTEIGKRCREYFLNLEKQWNSPDAVMARALQIADQKLELAKQQNGSLIETTAVQAKQIEEMKPKATYCDMVLQSAGLMPITTIAKDYGKSAKWLNKWLHEHGIQYKLGKVWLLYQKYADRGYVKSKTFTVLDENGDSIAKPNTQWTQRGRMFIYEQLKKEGILPLIEQDDS
ncbi:phage antirepressor KilAC domain-containing protein [Ruminococcus sp.]|nr:phage antirepressor KilAC domain-containing protein [Ruminococcus sp.]HOA00429.1 phage antirepressor KilAC domain-containing protein [Ruminococcus sp.]